MDIKTCDNKVFIGFGAAILDLPLSWLSYSIGNVITSK